VLCGSNEGDVVFAAVVPFDEWQMGFGLAASEKDMAAGSIVNVEIKVLCRQSEVLALRFV